MDKLIIFTSLLMAEKLLAKYSIKAYLNKSLDLINHAEVVYLINKNHIKRIVRKMVKDEKKLPKQPF